jgi:hypothetical protein
MSTNTLTSTLKMEAGNLSETLETVDYRKRDMLYYRSEKTH